MKKGLMICMSVMILGACQQPNQVFKEIASPNGEFKVAHFLKPGNMTTLNSYHLSVIQSEAAIGENEFGNLFSYDSGNGRDALFEPLIVTWEDSKTIKLSYSAEIYVISKVEEFQEFKIIHEVNQ